MNCYDCICCRCCSAISMYERAQNTIQKYQKMGMHSERRTELDRDGAKEEEEEKPIKLNTFLCFVWSGVLVKWFMRLQENKLIIISISYFMSGTKEKRCQWNIREKKNGNYNSTNRRHISITEAKTSSSRIVTCWTKCFRLISIQLLTDRERKKCGFYVCVPILTRYRQKKLEKKEHTHTRIRSTKGI